MTTTTDVRIERTLGAPPETVYAAWTDPATMERWYCPNPDLEVTVTADVRVGGPYRVQMGRYGVSGSYLELTPHAVITFTAVWDHEPRTVSRVRVELLPLDGGTLLVLTQTGLADAADAEGHTEGWTLALDRMAGLLAG